MIGPTNCTDTNAEGRGDIAPSLACCPACNHLSAVEDDPRSANWPAALSPSGAGVLQARLHPLTYAHPLLRGNCAEDDYDCVPPHKPQESRYGSV